MKYATVEKSIILLFRYVHEEFPANVNPEWIGPSDEMGDSIDKCMIHVLALVFNRLILVSFKSIDSPRSWVS